MYVNDWLYVNYEIDEEMGINITCPKCGKADEFDTQSNEYVTHVMNWCWGCNGNRTYIVLDHEVFTGELYNDDVFSKLEPEDIKCYEDDITSLKDQMDIGGQLFVPVLKILKLVNSDISKQYRITRGCSFHDDFMSARNEDELITLFQCGIDINGFDTGDADFDHDGIYVYLLCQNIHGKLVKVKFWGD